VEERVLSFNGKRRGVKGATRASLSVRMKSGDQQLPSDVTGKTNVKKQRFLSRSVKHQHSVEGPKRSVKVAVSVFLYLPSAPQQKEVTRRLLRRRGTTMTTMMRVTTVTTASEATTTKAG
jgi:hypothetical protein